MTLLIVAPRSVNADTTICGIVGSRIWTQIQSLNDDIVHAVDVADAISIVRSVICGRGAGAIRANVNRLLSRSAVWNRIRREALVRERVASFQEQLVGHAVSQESRARRDGLFRRRGAEAIVRVVARRVAHVNNPRIGAGGDDGPAGGILRNRHQHA